MSLSFRTLFVLGALLLPRIALAHSPIKGIGDFLNGVLHPVMAPAQLLLIVALGLWYGQNKPNQHKTAILAFLFATITGLFVTTLSPLSDANDIALTLLIGATLFGLITLSGLSAPQSLFMLSGLLSGFLLGLDSAQDDLSGKAKIAFMFGSGVGVYFLLLYAMALSESFSVKSWQTIAVRILSSWISASALMVLALQFSSRT